MKIIIGIKEMIFISFGIKGNKYKELEKKLNVNKKIVSNFFITNI